MSSLEKGAEILALRHQLDFLRSQAEALLAFSGPECQGRCHCWLDPPLQVPRSSWVLLSPATIAPVVPVPLVPPVAPVAVSMVQLAWQVIETVVPLKVSGSQT